MSGDHVGIAAYDPFNFVPNHDRLIPGGEFIFREPLVTPAVWGSAAGLLWPEGEGLMICGPQGVGKSTIAQQVVLAQVGVREDSVLGLPVARHNRVAYLAMDRPRQVARSFKRMVEPADRKRLDRHLSVWNGPLPFNLVSDPLMLAQWLEPLDADVVWVDSYKDLAPGLSDDKVGSAINIAVQEVLARGMQFAGLHHQRKASSENKKPQKLDDVYGSAWLTAGLGSVALLWGEPGASTIDFHHLKQPSEPVPDFTILHERQSGVSRVQGDVSLDVNRFLTARGAEGAGEDELARHAYGADNEANRKKLARLLKSMKENGAPLQHVAGQKGGSGGGGRAARWMKVEP